MTHRFISSKNPAYIIAEVGVNHEGALTEAFKLIDDAAEAGVDAVKFQAYKSNLLAAQNSPAYWDISEEPTNSQFELFSKYDHFGAVEYRQLHSYALNRGLDFMLTCFDLEFVEELADLSPVLKIASADITNVPLLKAVAQRAEAVILSTGAATFSEISIALNILDPSNKPIALLHCVLNYPTESKNASLTRISMLQKDFPQALVGYSDHTKPKLGNSILNTAFALGARIFEKHFTNNLELRGNDHYHSMDKELMKSWLSELKVIEQSLHFSEDKFLMNQESAIKFARRGIYASQDILKGDLLSSGNIVALRPVAETPASDWEKILNGKANKNINKGDPIKTSDISLS